jgi:hypothetical protein
MSKTLKCGIYARHLGDYWCRINYMLRLVGEVEEQYDEIHFLTPAKRPYMYEMGGLINSLLDYPFKNKLSVKQVPNEEFKLDIHIASKKRCAAAYFCNYYRTERKWENIEKKENKVCVAYDANFCKDQKTPIYLKQLNEVLSEDFEVVELTHPMTVNEYITHLSECKCFFTVENGISHIARSVGCPIIITEHQYPASTGHPKWDHNSWVFHGSPNAAQLGLKKGDHDGYFYETASSAIEAYSKISNHVYGKEILLDQIRSTIKKARYIHSAR